ncbi:uncharacterized protein KD926_002046 [Aspergillus affinis]|uniref:uncharacterized protein n=1 Tax=Aspergillus affinis TaxID=1070780 RepID=UPI0022FE5C6C|nr:uncharacterized protein KD926_002046 [Aspergillus affinis]KAI9036334.1 hypothetical protein KD926_002046 [Aspergillus affinis]
MKFTAVLFTLVSLQGILAAPAGKLKLCETERWKCFRGLTSMPNIAWAEAEEAEVTKRDSDIDNRIYGRPWKYAKRDSEVDNRIYGTPWRYAKRDSDIDNRIYGRPWKYAKREEAEAEEVNEAQEAQEIEMEHAEHF